MLAEDPKQSSLQLNQSPYLRNLLALVMKGWGNTQHTLLCSQDH